MTFKIYKDSPGEFRWRLRAANSRIITDSAEGYRSEADCETGIRLVKTDAPSASVNDETLSGLRYGR